MSGYTISAVINEAYDGLIIQIDPPPVAPIFEAVVTRLRSDRYVIDTVRDCLCPNRVEVLVNQERFPVVPDWLARNFAQHVATFLHEALASAA